MKAFGRFAWMAMGIAVGMAAAMFYCGQPRQAGAAAIDRYQDTIMATGAVTLNPRVQTDGVWLLDYKSGKLLGNVIDRTQGKMGAWAEVDLQTEFGIVPKQDVHFVMVTGYITQGQAALYLSETTTGQMGVYTLGPGQNGGIVIRRHDLTKFRQPAAAAGALPAPPGGLPATP
jgi:hypothetical protein